MQQSVHRRLCLLIPVALALVACAGTLQVGVERAGPRPDTGAVVTLAALQAEHARLSTEVAALALVAHGVERSAAPTLTPALPTAVLTLPPPDEVGPSVDALTPEARAPTALAPAQSTYADAQLGFAVDYPADWVVDDSGPAITLASYDLGAPGAGSGGGRIPFGETRIDLAFSEPGRALGLEAMAAQGRIAISTDGGDILSEQRVALVSGAPAVLFRVRRPFGQTAELYTVVGGRGVHIAGYGDLACFEEVALTLRPYP